MENLPADTVVAVVSTTDEDTLLNNTKAYYSITGTCMWQKYHCGIEGIHFNVCGICADCIPCGNMSLFEVNSVDGRITTVTSLVGC